MAVTTVKATINGQEYALTYNNTSKKYEATIPAPSQTSGMNNNGSGPGVGTLAQGKGYYPVTLTATDDAGNTTTIDDTDNTHGQALRLKVKETVAPVASFTYPTASATIASNKPAIAFKFTDSGSGVNPTSCKIKVDSGTEQSVTLTGSNTQFTGTFTPTTALSDGSHTVTVYAYDYDGNKSNVASVSFKVDTTPPTLTLDSPNFDKPINVTSGVISGTTNDALSSPVTVVATINGKDVGTISVGSDGRFSKSVTWSLGTNTVVVTATDAVGKESSVTRTVTVDTGAPVFGTPVITPNPTETGVSYTISVEVTD